MRTRYILAALFFTLLVTCAPAVVAQTGGWRFDAARVPVGQVFHFVKSQRDGTQVANISVYPPSVAELGEVWLRFEGREQRDGRELRLYAIGGPGLEGTQGTWWADAATGLLVEYELPVGDELGYRDVRLRLESSGELTLAAWETFKRRSIGDD